MTALGSIFSTIKRRTAGERVWCIFKAKLSTQRNHTLMMMILTLHFFCTHPSKTKEEPGDEMVVSITPAATHQPLPLLPRVPAINTTVAPIGREQDARYSSTYCPPNTITPGRNRSRNYQKSVCLLLRSPPPRRKFYPTIIG